MKPVSQTHLFWARLILIVGSALVFLYSWAYLFVVPYLGFLPAVPDGEIINVYITDPGIDKVQVGDRFIRGGTQTWQEFIDNPAEVLFQDAQAGENYLVVVERNGSRVSLMWEFPGLNPDEFYFRLRQAWWIPFILLFGAIGTFIFARPRNQFWYLLTIFFTALSVWVSAGLTAHTQIFFSRYLAHFSIWILVAVGWHFHWIFPTPLTRVPRFAGWVLYSLCLLIAVAEIIVGLSVSLMYLGALFLTFGILGMLFAHIVRQEGSRAEIRLLMGGLLLAFLPSILYLLLDTTDYDTGLLYIPVLLSFGLIPIAYLYSIYYHRLGGLELRANRAIGILIYAVLLFVIAMFTGLVLRLLYAPLDSSELILILMFVLLGLVSPFLFPKFQSWLNRRIFNISLPPDRLIEGYANLITASLDKEHLATLLGEQIFPSLMIRQAALVRLETNASGYPIQRIVPVLALDIPESWLPCVADIPALAQQAGKIRLPDDSQQPCPWARLVFTLNVEERMIGLCMFGRRDPDDYYSPSEIPSLQALMDQTALALINIEQAHNLRTLYQVNIDRQESERLRLARILHDEVLSQMALLAQYADPSKMDPKFNLAYQTSVDYIRDIIAGLRPTTLNFGLHVALEELVDEYSANKPAQESKPQYIFDIPASPERYPDDVELHLYRIVQQALKNAQNHARAGVITLEGCLEPDAVQLLVKDDGIGFPSNAGMEIAGLLARKHYGLAGMHERAAIIAASLQIDSRPGFGTGISIIWGPTASSIE